MPLEEDITPLYTWSGYSPLRGPASLERLVESARRLGHTHLALTDTNNLYGAVPFWRLAGQAGLRPLLGAELRDARRTVVALIASRRGYENLCRLLTAAWHEEGFDLLADAGLPGRCEGLHLVTEDPAAVEALAAAGVAPSRLWVGLDGEAQSPGRLRRLLRVAGRLGLPPVALGKAMFTQPGEHETARLLAAMRCGATFGTVPGHEVPHAGAFLRRGRRLARALADVPEALRNNRRLVEQCSAFRLLPRRWVFPTFPAPEGLPPHAYLRRLCREGIARRYGRSRPAVEARLQRELGLIARRGLSAYFLLVWDIVRQARRLGAPVAGRGSGAGSLVAYLLGITNVCPLAYDLPFERFLNEQREDFPDLDLDFCWRIRDDVIDYALRRWGAGRAAMVCTHNTFQRRSAFRETARAFGLSDEQIRRLDEADLAPDAPDAGRLGRIADFARRLVGLLHNLSVHPGGIVVAPDALARHVPTQPAPKGVDITQYDKDGVEAVGLIKLDLLGNRSISTIAEACRLIARRRGERIDVEALPPDDAATASLLRTAETVGCNQLESPGMRHLLLALQPGGVRGLMEALALIRPGAASIGMKEVFIRRRRGLEPVPRGHPAVDALLAGTCGVMLYEDDVMLVAAALLGGNVPEADRFRKAVQKCRTDAERIELSRRFLARCRAGGVADDFARDLWVQMAKFNSYSFCRAHAASYAVLAYAAAYLKAHYPLEYWTACLNNNQSMYHPRVYVEQARRAGIRFALPDINRSGSEFSIDIDPRGREVIRVGLGRIRGLGPAAVEAVLAARAERQFDGLTDCLARTRLGRDEARALVQCGAFDSFGHLRPTLMMELNLFFALRPHRPRRQGELIPARPTVPEAPEDYPPLRKYIEERRILGISTRGHILGLYRPALAGRVTADSRRLVHRVGRTVRLAGVLEARRTTATRGGGTMMFLTFDDEFGLFEVTVFPDALAALGPLDRYGPYLVSGIVEEQYDAITVAADQVRLCGVRPGGGAFEPTSPGGPPPARRAPAAAEALSQPTRAGTP